MAARTTLTSDPLDILLAHDDWATRMLLERCRPLTRDQFHKRYDIGMGSLHDNLTHIVGVYRRWTDRIDGRPLRPALSPVPGRPDIRHDAKDRTPDELLALHGQAVPDLRAVVAKWRATPDGLASLVHPEWPRKEGELNRYTFTRGCCLTHVCSHGTYHRAQCVNMMRHLNAPGLSDDLPDPSVIDWQAETESPPVPV
ncbi:MAG TPA: DinB family protein [Phycisphaerales bacterium]|nr:DinB family protein [Phycisphaerales bacterium]